MEVYVTFDLDNKFDACNWLDASRVLRLSLQAAELVIRIIRPCLMFCVADLRASRQSLMEDGRRSRASAMQRSMMRKSTRGQSVSRSRSRGPGDRRAPRDTGDRGSSGYRSRDGDSLPDSDNWATSTDNNWTDYDQEVYTVRSPQKSGRYSRDDVNL